MNRYSIENIKTGIYLLGIQTIKNVCQMAHIRQVINNDLRQEIIHIIISDSGMDISTHMSII